MRTPGQPGTRTGRAGRAVQGRRDERGVALVIAIGVIAVALSLSLLVVTIALRQNESSRVDRTRAVAVNAAEAGVDAAFAALQSAGPILPCSIPDLDAQVPVDEYTVTVQVEYYPIGPVDPVDDTAVSAIDCTDSLENPANSTLRALITATAQPKQLAGGSTQGKRAMQALVTLRPKVADGFDNAIFAQQTLDVSNTPTVYGDEGNDANIYSNGDIICGNGSNQTYQGSIYSQGEVRFDGQCSVLGEIWAGGAVTIGHNQTTIGGNVTSSAHVSVMDSEQVYGTITAPAITEGKKGGSASCRSGQCFIQEDVPPPPEQPFPQLLVDPSVWAGSGYVSAGTYAGNCSDADDEMLYLAENPSATTEGFVISTNCKVSFSSAQVAMENDLVIYAAGGFSSSQQVTFKSGDDKTHRLYWIVPYGTSCDPGDSGDIVISQHYTVDPSVEFLMYTPCDISVAQNSQHVGQIYGGGAITLGNNFDMDFEPLPVYGVDPASLPLLSHDVDVIYKREVRP